MITRAITRLPGENFGQGITTTQLGKPDYSLMLRQHAAYVDALRGLGLSVDVLPALASYPDAYFVEDVAVVTPEMAVIARPGAPSRRGETEYIEIALARWRTIERITGAGTLEGGDVLMAGRHFFIGLSVRTNREGAQQLGRLLTIQGYTWTPVPVASGLHLKSSVNWVGERTLLISRALADRSEFEGWDLIVLDPEDEYACNSLLVNETLIVPAGFPRVLRKLKDLNCKIIELEASEARKMDGGLTCLSLRF